jgi:2-dehydropantoate 2-reductase
MKIAIIGAGAVGLGIGSGLVAAGEDVRFIARNRERRAAMQARGFQRSGFFGEQQVEAGRFEVCESTHALADGREDVWLVCVKSTANDALARDLAQIWPKLEGTSGPPAIVLCQNGWGNAEAFARWLPKSVIFNARVITGFVFREINHVEVTAHAEAIHVGSLFAADIAPLAPLCEAISKGGIPCELAPQIAQDLWAKLLYNGLLNPLGALVGVRYGVLGERPTTRAVMQAVAEEIFAVLTASGHTTHWRSASEYLAFFYEHLLPTTGNHHSSMLQDLRAGKKTEIDAICGAVCDLGDAHGVEAPVNRALRDLIRGAECHDQGAA